MKKSRDGRRIVSWALFPALTVAAGVLGYYSWLSASQFAQLGEETIVQSTLLLVREKVDSIERYVIDQDNAVMARIDFGDLETSLVGEWPSIAGTISPSVRAVVVLDENGATVGTAVRGSDEDTRDFLKVFLERIQPDLEIEQLETDILKHLHRTYAGRSYLISYKAVAHADRRYYVALHHDTGFIVREQFPTLFATDEGKRLYNVVNEDNRRIFGPSLAQAGDYLVGHRFPTTLYGWRLQLAPKQAPLLDAQSRSRRLNEAALIATSLVVVFLGIAFLYYAVAQERRLNQLKSEFIANVSHELKTPLSVIRMFGELLLTKRVQNAEKQEQYLELICRESERLTALIDNVLDFAALERGRTPYELREGDLHEAVARAIDAFRYRLEKDGADVRIVTHGTCPPVRFDEQAIVLAVLNLLDNAFKYGEKTPVEVHIEPGRRSVHVKVRDHGPGIPLEATRRIFERFYRVHRGETRGSGIGLALVQHIAEAHGGRAWATNAEDGGAVVAFSIPLHARAMTPEPVSPEPAESRT